MAGSRNKWLRGTEIGLLLVGGICTFVIVVCAVFPLLLLPTAGRSVRFGPTVHAQASDPTRHLSVNTDTDGTKQAVVMGRLDIPGIGLSVPILSDYQALSLLRGIGHVPGTAMPGGLGTLGLAGHRDTYFRPLRQIKRNMDIRVADEDGVYHYVVDSTEVVTPQNVEVLDIRYRPELTLITCYPFYYVGAAPMRFIVHAHLLSALPDPK